MQLVIGFDFDETLSPTGHDYDRAYLTSALTVIMALGRHGPSLRTVLDLHRTIDDELIQEYQFQVRRTPLSWVETYCRAAEQFGLPFDRLVARKMYRTASECIRRGPFELYDGVVEVLETLRQAGHELHLLTIGEDVHQRHKIKATGISGFFGDNIHVIPMDKREAMRQVFGGREHRSWMVGDSRGSDIQAALETGAQAVWASYGNPARQHDGHVKGEFRCIKHIRELPELLHRFG